MKKPKFKNGDLVEFRFLDIFKQGIVEVVDVYGYFGQETDEPSYDIYCSEDGCIYKHIEESYIVSAVPQKDKITRGVLQYHQSVGFTMLFSKDGYEEILDRPNLLIRLQNETEWNRLEDVGLYNWIGKAVEVTIANQ